MIKKFQNLYILEEKLLSGSSSVDEIKEAQRVSLRLLIRDP